MTDEWKAHTITAESLLRRALKGDPFYKFADGDFHLRCSVIADSLPGDRRAALSRFTEHCPRHDIIMGKQDALETATAILAQLPSLSLPVTDRDRLSSAMQGVVDAISDFPDWSAEDLVSCLNGRHSRPTELKPRFTFKGCQDPHDVLFALAMLGTRFGRIRVLQHDRSYLEFEAVLLAAVNQTDVDVNSSSAVYHSEEESDDRLDWYGYNKANPVRVCDAGFLLSGEDEEDFNKILHPRLVRPQAATSAAGEGPSLGVDAVPRVDKGKGKAVLDEDGEDNTGTGML